MLVLQSVILLAGGQSPNLSLPPYTCPLELTSWPVCRSNHVIAFPGGAFLYGGGGGGGAMVTSGTSPGGGGGGKDGFKGGSIHCGAAPRGAILIG